MGKYPFYSPYGIFFISLNTDSVFVCWVGNEEQEKVWLAIQVRKLKNQLDEIQANCLKEPTFDVNNCTREAMEKRCKEIGLNAENTELAIKFFVDRVSLWKIAEELDIEYDSVNKRKKRLKNKLK